MNSVVHFEIPFDKLDRIKKFYEEVFGWKLMELPNQEYVMAYTVDVDDNFMPKQAGAINGGLTKRDKNSQSTVVVVNVADINQHIKMVEAAGGSLVSGPDQVMDMGLYARVKDSEDNVIGLWQTLKM